MYAILIALHSLFRWLVVLSLTYATAVACQGWITKRAFSKYDNLVRHGTATIAHIQLLLGLALYFVSPIVQYFLQNFSEGVHQREIRFFGMEHIFMMLLAIALLTVGAVKTKRQTADVLKFKTMAIWFSVAWVVIFFSIPWPFLPLSPHRPYFRMF